MGVLDQFMNFMKIDGPDEQDSQYDYDDKEDYIDSESSGSTEDGSLTENKIRTFTQRASQKGRKMVPNQDGAAVCVFKPTNVSESREITMTLRANKTVVLNLEDADDISAQRILDFTSGSCFALDGTLQKISNYIFIVTPASVDITGDLQDTIAESFGL